MNLQLTAAFLVSHRFGDVVFSFPFSFKKFLVSSLISILSLLFGSELFRFHKFVYLGHRVLFQFSYIY